MRWDNSAFCGEWSARSILIGQQFHQVNRLIFND